MGISRIFVSPSLVGLFAMLATTGCMTELDATSSEHAELASEPFAAETADITPGNTIVIPPGPDEGGAHIEAVAPSCVSRSLLSSRLLNVTNRCSTTQWVKVVIALGPDSSCFELRANGGSKNVSWTIGTYDGLFSC